MFSNEKFVMQQAFFNRGMRDFDLPLWKTRTVSPTALSIYEISFARHRWKTH